MIQNSMRQFSCVFQIITVRKLKKNIWFGKETFNFNGFMKLRIEIQYEYFCYHSTLYEKKI